MAAGHYGNFPVSRFHVVWALMWRINEIGRWRPVSCRLTEQWRNSQLHVLTGSCLSQHAIKYVKISVLRYQSHAMLISPTPQQSNHYILKDKNMRTTKSCNLNIHPFFVDFIGNWLSSAQSYEQGLCISSNGLKGSTRMRIANFKAKGVQWAAS